MAFDKELLKGTLPLLVLHLIDEGDTYGYALIKAMEERSAGAFTLAEGTLYPVLHALERDRYVVSHWDASGSGRRRKYYRITALGRADLARRRAEWQRFATAVTATTKEATHEHP